MTTKMIVRLNALVLAFFLVLFAMSKIEQGSLNHFLNAFFGVQKQQEPQVQPTLRRAKIIKLPQQDENK